MAKPARWSEVYRVDADEVSTISGEQCPLHEVRAWFSATPDNELFEIEGDLPLLPGIHGLVRHQLPEPERVTEAELRKGRSLVLVTHGPCALPWRDARHFSTQLLNVGQEAFTVTSFSAYARQRPGIYWTTMRFSATQFRAWYDLGIEEWIAPGARVWDPANYSDRATLWAYRCETRGGLNFVTGEVSA